MNSVLGSYLTMGLSMLNSIRTQQAEHRERIIAKWEESKNYPRKKKKAARKRLELEWLIASYDPYEGYKIF